MSKQLGEHMSISLKGMVAFYKSLLTKGTINKNNKGTGAYQRYIYWKDMYNNVGNKYFKQRELYEESNKDI